MSKILLISVLLLFINGHAFGQSEPEATGAFWRSLAVPGWGHYYVDHENWGRGQAHLGADMVLIASYFGLNARASNLEDHVITLAKMNAGVDISGKDRTFRLAIGDFDNIDSYNDYQLRTRNWNRLYDNIPENNWNWQEGEDRQRYRELRSDVDRIRNQLPAIVGLMVVNRVISAISAYNRARIHSQSVEVSVMPANSIIIGQGAVATVQWKF